MLFQASFNYWIILIQKIEGHLKNCYLYLRTVKRFLHHSYIFGIVTVNYGTTIILALEPTSLQMAIASNSVDNSQYCCTTVEFVPCMGDIHHFPFMHRDLKPSNVLLSKKGHIRISLDTFKSKGAGKLRLMAPEILRSGRRQWSAIHEQGRGLLVRHHTHLYRHWKLPQVQHTKCSQWSPPSAARHDHWLSSRAACRTNQTGAYPLLRSSIQEGG